MSNPQFTGASQRKYGRRYNERMPTTQPTMARLTRPETPIPFRITERDMAIVTAIARYRFLASDQVQRIVGGSERGVRNRLRNLFAHEFLDRPQHQRYELASFLNPPLVYGLGRHGARLLSILGRSIDHRLDWTTKNARATSPYLAHTIEVAEVMMAFAAACHDSAAQLIEHHELLPHMPQSARKVRDPFALRVRVQHRLQKLTTTVVPDRLFALLYPDTRHNFALELDRGTMDIDARRLVGKSSFRRKLLGYAQAWRGKQHVAAWGFKSFRVLTVTTSETRIEHMIAVQREVA